MLRCQACTPHKPTAMHLPSHPLSSHPAQTTQAWQSEVLGTAGQLLIVDVYAGWCGPCKAVQSTFKRLHMEQPAGASVPLRFFTANADSVPALEAHRGKSMPLFQFYRDGRLLESVEGVEVPKLVALAASLAKK